MPGTMLSRGNILYAYTIAPSLTPAAVAVSTSAEQTFTIQGLILGDQIGAVGPTTTQTAGIFIVNSRVPSNDRLIIQFGNHGSATATPVSGLYQVEVNRPETGGAALPTTAG